MIRTGAGPAVDGYIDSVMRGAVNVGRYERLMVERQLDDIRTGGDRGLVWDPDLGQLVVDFMHLCRHSKGRWAGRPLELEPWQEFWVTTLFGWMRGDGTRRFRRSLLFIGRKNGKSTLASAIGLYGLVADGEGGAEIYAAATKKEQARIVFTEAQRMVEKSPALRSEITVHENSIFVRGTASRFVPLSADDRKASGHNTHIAIIDELHEHPTAEMWDVMRTSMGAREQPLLLATTTAGDDENSICGEQFHFAERVLEGTIEVDEFFPAIYMLDDADKWKDESCWRQSNPNIGVTVSIEEMREMAKEAEDNPRSLNSFLRYKLNRWVSSSARWFQPDVWDACGEHVDEAALEGRVCYGGLDLASVEDVAAWVLLFPPDRADGVYQVLCRFFVPEHAIARRSVKASVPYDVWSREGHLIATPGEVIDHDLIFDAIDADAQRFDLQEICFDRWGAARVYTQMEDRGLTVMQMGQGYASMSGPSKELERLVRQERIHYGEQPVMRWMGHNAVATEDPAGNIKPDKGKAKEKIDGVVALVMALDRAMRRKGRTRSVYEDRGIAMI